MASMRRSAQVETGLSSAALVFEGPARLLSSEPSSALAESESGDSAGSIGVQTPEVVSSRWVTRLRRRSHFYLKWIEQYRED